MDAKIPVNNLLSTWGRLVGFFIAWVTAVWSGRGTGNTRGTSFPFPSLAWISLPALFSFESLSQACRFKDKRQIGFHKHYQRTLKTTVKQKCEKKWRIEKKEKYILLAKLGENWRYKCFVFVVNVHDQILTSLKKSPTHLAIIRTSIIGMPKLMFPVASIKITVRLIVIRTTPPARKARKD